MGWMSASGRSRRAAALAAACVAAVAVFCWAAAVASAAETVYWNNYESNGIAYANVDGSGGGQLNLSGVELEDPEGMAYDSVTNRIYVTSAKDQILYVNLDGSGAGILNTAGAKVESPEGLGIDPNNRTVYWYNTDSETIGSANLDGSGGSMLNTTGATTDGAYRLAVDPVGGRVYWGNTGPAEASISYANVDGSGGGNLDLTGATAPNDISGLAVVPSAGRIYWVDDELVSYASLGGGGGGDLNLTGAVFDSPYGLAIDPATGKLYWGNYGRGSETTGAIGFGNLSGGGGGIDIATAPVKGPQDPLILKSPSGTGAPQVSRATSSPAALSCSTGSWAGDLAGSSVYQAPRSFSYVWKLNGSSIGGVTGSSLTAGSAGTYTCEVTATNQTGSATQTSAGVSVTAGSATLGLAKKKAKSAPGKTVQLSLTVTNPGNLPTAAGSVCAELSKKAKKALKAPKCASLGAIAAGGSATVKLGVPIKKSAKSGTYQLSLIVKGVSGGPVSAKIQVKAKKHHKKHNKGKKQHKK